MKYVLPLVVSFMLCACNDSSTTQSVSSSSETNETTQTQTSQTVASPSNESNNATQTLSQDTNMTEVSGETIFGKCKTCHGVTAEKSALGSSKVIKDWDAAKIEEALKGYQNGTYGGSMKNIMAAQAKGLSDDEIKKVAAYIHSL